MWFRSATMDDAELLLRWRNDPLTRNASFTQHQIDITCHRVWLMQKLESPSTNIMLCGIDGDNGRSHLAGAMRSEWQNGHQVNLHWTIAPEWRGQGVGTRMLRSVLSAAPLGVECIACIKEDNIASQRVAEKAGMLEYSPGRWVWVNIRR